MRKLLDWVDSRTGFISGVGNFLDEKIPASAGWHQVFGSVALFLFLVQGFTGVLLALNYAPQPGDAYYSVKYIIEELTGGRIIRGLHHWGASLMVIVVVVHMAQVFLWGAYKKPREATWLIGVGLLLLVFGFGLTGYLLPWDNRAYWATVVTIQISALVPGAGDFLLRLLGSPDGKVGVATFSRFYTLHVIVLPALASLLVVLHVGLVRRHGVTPAPEDSDRPKKKFHPDQTIKDTAAIFVAFVTLLVLAVVVDAPLERLADPTDKTYIPRPEWYFLFLFQLLRLFEGPFEVFGAVVLPTAAVCALALVPFVDRGKVVRVRQRTVAASLAALGAIGWAGLTTAAVMASPEQAAGPVQGLTPAADWTRLTPVELAGAACFRQEGCGICHNLADGEPKVGPTLATVAERRSADWMIAHFRNPSQVVPGSPMPPARVSDELLNALSAFLLKLTPENAERFGQIPEFALRAGTIYLEKGCGNCHVVNGVGTQLGPVLNGVGQRRSREWMVEHFRDPRSRVPDSIMPAYEFKPGEVEALVKYLSALPPA